MTDIHVHIHVHPVTGDLTDIVTKLDHIIAQGDSMALDMTAFDAEITHLTDVEDSTKALITLILGELTSAAAVSQTAFDAKVAELSGHLTEFGSFVAANTPAAPTPPVVEPTPTDVPPVV